MYNFDKIRSMKVLKYKELPGINPFGSPVPNTVGTFVSFLFAMPYVMHCGLVPPIQVLNDLLRSGLLDAGMSGGCQWEPFEIGLEEYDDLVLELLTLPNQELSVDKEFDYCTSYEEWRRAVSDRYDYDKKLRKYVKK